jgi:ABC-type antimicrobial peptide transport system permease subunit
VALGASTGSILGEVIGRGLRLAMIGVLVGTALALALSRVIAGVLYEVSATDAATFLLAPLVLLSIATVACFIPARRATRVDPIVALRAE